MISRKTARLLTSHGLLTPSQCRRACKKYIIWVEIFSLRPPPLRPTALSKIISITLIAEADGPDVDGDRAARAPPHNRLASIRRARVHEVSAVAAVLYSSHEAVAGNDQSRQDQ